MATQQQFIERRIIIGMIVSDEYLQFISDNWEPRYFESATAKMLASWCFDYYKKYNKAPMQDIEGIYFDKLKEKVVPANTAADIEDILGSMSEEYEHDKFNVPYLVEQTKTFLRERFLETFAKDIIGALAAGKIHEADKLAASYHDPVHVKSEVGINPFKAKDAVEKAFEEDAVPVMTFSKDMGHFMNEQLTRGSFIVFQGPEKRGKTFWLLEMAMRAFTQGCNVAFFQCGDMTEPQLIRRMGVYLCKCSDKERYCGGNYLPVVDCIKNQCDTCKNSARESDFGVFTVPTHQNYFALREACDKYPEYRPCHNCKEIEPTVYFEKTQPQQPINGAKAWIAFRKMERQAKREFKLATYPSDTLTVSEIKDVLDVWEKQDGFIPDVLVIDYADIMAPDDDQKKNDMRHQINGIWKRLRTLSQERHCLLISATQAAMTSYGKHTQTLADFSEDKRKYGHVTAMYGMNQTLEEKRIGIMRLNELVKREGASDVTQCAVLQRLEIGKPFVGSLYVSPLYKSKVLRSGKKADKQEEDDE
jgi:hypothetical protein